MKRLFLGLAVASLISGCARKSAEVTEASVEQVAAWLQADSATVCDANDDEYRTVVGSVPGAVLLTNFKDYDVKATLPADKTRQLVFYCTSRT